MLANARTVRNILYTGDQYLIPFFQRYYSWSRKHWERLRNDLWVIIESGKKEQHFLGPMVCIATTHVPGEVPAYQLIDGQQRLTTLTLLLAALRDVAKEKQLDRLANKVHEECLIHRNEEALQRYKVVPRIGDREALISIIESEVKPEHSRYNVVRAWKFFRQNIRRFASKGDPQERLQQLFSTVADQFSLVVITIDSENPYEIFESLNSTGLPLSEADLIRNYLFMQVSLKHQQKFHDQSWTTFEKLFDKAPSYDAADPTQFYRNYLMFGGTYVPANETFVQFKNHHKQSGKSSEQLVEELQRLAKWELLLRRPATSDDAELRAALREIDLLDITTAYPLLLALFDRFEQKLINRKTLLECIADLQSFVLRRSICGETTRAYGRWFVEAAKAMGDDPLANLRAYWAKRGWPDDETFKNRLVEFALYRRESRKCLLILERLGRAANPKEPIANESLTIEHVMPQTIRDDESGQKWQAMLGSDWEPTHEKWLHTIGNLTLTGYNSNLSNRPFEEKKAALKESNVPHNRMIADLPAWNAAAIAERGNQLAAKVAELWARPTTEKYVPVEDDDAAETKAANYKKRRELYWHDLAQLLQDFGEVPPPKAINDATDIYFPVDVPNMRIWAWLVRPRSEIVAGVSFQKTAGRNIYKQLHTIKGEIESEFGEALHWANNMITLARPDSRLVDEEDWFDQHEWLSEKLASFYTVVMPRIRTIANSKGAVVGEAEVAGDDPRERYWEMLREAIEAHESGIRIRSNASLASINSAFPGTDYGVKFWVYPEKQQIGLRLIGYVSASERLVNFVRGSRSNVEKVLGDQIFKRGKRGKAMLQLSQEANFADEADWPRQHQWLIDRAAALDAAIRPDIEAFAAVSANSDS